MFKLFFLIVKNVEYFFISIATMFPMVIVEIPLRVP